MKPFMLYLLLAAWAPLATGDLAAELRVARVRAVTTALQAQGGDSVQAARVAEAVVTYADRNQLDPALVVGVIAVENRELVPHARSREGALGIMQVMPHWRHDIRDCGRNLTDIPTNVCFGTRILRLNLDQARTVRGALLRYNGCRRAPGCGRYADAVLRRVERAALYLTPPESTWRTTTLATN